MEDIRTKPYHNIAVPKRIRSKPRGRIARRPGSTLTGLIGNLWEFSHSHTLTVCILFLLGVSSLAFGREADYAVSGRVIDAATEKGLAFANILVENTNLHTSTNEEGDFNFTLPMRQSRIRVSYIGYKPQSIDVSAGESRVIVKLAPTNFLLEEVSVVATKTSDRIPNSIQLGNAEIKDFAGVTGDPLRSLQMMPGVTTNDEASAQMDVRGGTWDENSILIDGAEIQNPYHLKEVSLASIGIFNMDMVKSIDFSAGGWGAKYGNALSSITRIDYKEGDHTHFDGDLHLGLLDMSGSFQGPIDKNSSFIVAVRRSYFGDILQMTHASPGIYAGYYDIQGDVDYKFNELNKLKVDFIYSNDDATQSPSNTLGTYAYSSSVLGHSTIISRHTTLMQTFWGRYATFLFSANSQNVLTNRLISRTLVYYSGDIEHEKPIQTSGITQSYDGFPDLWLDQTSEASETYDLDMRTASISQEFDYKLTSFLDLQAGAGFKRIFYNYFPDMYSFTTTSTNALHFPDTTVSITSGSLEAYDTSAIVGPSYVVDSYLQQTFQIGNSLVLNLGARFDYFELDKQGEYSPRANLTYRLPLGIKMNAAWGIYYQLPDFDQIRMPEASEDNTHFQKANQYVLGFEKNFLNKASLGIDFYQKYYSDLIPTIRMPYGSLYYGTKQNDAVGFAKGLDFQCSLNFEVVNLFLSYSYLVAKEKTPGTEYYPRCTDQRNTATIALIFNLGSEWQVNLRGYYGSGYAFTPCIPKLDPSTGLTVWTEGSKNSSHYPAYERLDFRISKTFFVMHSPLQLYLAITNVFNRRNVWSYNYTYDSKGNPTIEPLLLLPLVPTIGTSYSFQF